MKLAAVMILMILTLMMMMMNQTSLLVEKIFLVFRSTDSMLLLVLHPALFFTHSLLYTSIHTRIHTSIHTILTCTTF